MRRPERWAIALYGDGPDNWLVSVRQTYLRDPSVLQWGTTAAFLIFTVPATIFSPIGEELFFRGMAHESVRGRWGTGIATVVNSAAFGCVHLLHHGIAREGPRWMLRPGTGMLWLLLTMGLGWLFTVCRERSGSIWPAVLGHSGANLAMNLMIFFVLGGGGRSSP